MREFFTDGKRMLEIETFGCTTFKYHPIDGMTCATVVKGFGEVFGAIEKWKSENKIYEPDVYAIYNKQLFADIEYGKDDVYITIHEELYDYHQNKVICCFDFMGRDFGLSADEKNEAVLRAAIDNAFMRINGAIPEYTIRKKR